MDFEEWLEEYREDKNRSDADWYPNNVQIFEAGQQSKQEEVNKRQAQLDKLQWQIDALKSKVQELWTELDDRQSKEYIIERCEPIIQEILK